MEMGSNIPQKRGGQTAYQVLLSRISSLIEFFAYVMCCIPLGHAQCVSRMQNGAAKKMLTVLGHLYTLFGLIVQTGILVFIVSILFGRQDTLSELMIAYSINSTFLAAVVL